MVGSTFAYFTATVNRDDEEDKAFTANTAVITATYSEGSVINLGDNAEFVPGNSGSKEITITNSSGVDVDFEIAFDGTYSNSFTHLQYKLEKGDGTASSINGLTTSIEPNEEGFVTMEKSNLHDSKNTLVTGHLTAGAHQTFTLTIKLKEMGVAQPEDASGVFTGKLQATVNTAKPAA